MVWWTILKKQIDKHGTGLSKKDKDQHYRYLLHRLKNIDYIHHRGGGISFLKKLENA